MGLSHAVSCPCAKNIVRSLLQVVSLNLIIRLEEIYLLQIWFFTRILMLLITVALQFILLFYLTIKSYEGGYSLNIFPLNIFA